MSDIQRLSLEVSRFQWVAAAAAGAEAVVAIIVVKVVVIIVEEVVTDAVRTYLMRERVQVKRTSGGALSQRPAQHC